MGHVHQINVSDGGVPKLAVDGAQVGPRGIIGDAQADTVHHGSPDQALCLYSLEVIEGLRAEGHPIEPGSTGENLTLAGIDWVDVSPGRRLRIGPVLVEITDYANPCSKNAQWFLDGRFSRMHPKRHPGESRVYARVIEEGSINSDDTVSFVD